MSTVPLSEFGIDLEKFCAVLRHKKTGIKYATPEYTRETLREYLHDLNLTAGLLFDVENWYNAKVFAIDYYRTGKSAGYGLEAIKKA